MSSVLLLKGSHGYVHVTEKLHVSFVCVRGGGGGGEWGISLWIFCTTLGNHRSLVNGIILINWLLTDHKAGPP